MANKKFGTLYTGVTSDLLRRIFEHRNDLTPGFCAQYRCKKLVFYSFFETMSEAIEMEKKLKKGSRIRKIRLIDTLNSMWNDLYEVVTQ